jgi:hypothetical protein
VCCRRVVAWSVRGGIVWCLGCERTWWKGYPTSPGRSSREPPPRPPPHLPHPLVAAWSTTQRRRRLCHPPPPGPPLQLAPRRTGRRHPPPRARSPSGGRGGARTRGASVRRRGWPGRRVVVGALGEGTQRVFTFLGWVEKISEGNCGHEVESVCAERGILAWSARRRFAGTRRRRRRRPWLLCCVCSCSFVTALGHN